MIVERGNSQNHASICPIHIDEPVLQRLVNSRVADLACSYCGSPAAPIDDFMTLFLVGVHFRYVDARQEGVPWEESEYADYVLDATRVANEICDLAGIHDEAIRHDVESLMPAEMWVEKSWQVTSPADRLSYNWDGFKELVKYESRYWFVARDRRDPHDLDEMSPIEFFDAVAVMLRDTAGVYKALPFDELYRGRMCASMPDIDTYDGLEIGPPPRNKAAANRMSPAGIVMFYGSTDLDTVIAEIGAHSSYSYAVTGTFRVVAGLQVVDLTSLPQTPSIFDPDAADLAFALEFLRAFIADATLPVDLDGREHIDYVPTQVFTEYLHAAFPGRLDGVVFPSAQGPGKNVVLFCDSSRCARPGEENERTMLTLDPGSIRGHRIKSVIATTRSKST